MWNCAICALQGREVRRRGKVHRVWLHINKIDAVGPFILVRSYFIYMVGPSQDRIGQFFSSIFCLCIVRVEIILRCKKQKKKTEDEIWRCCYCCHCCFWVWNINLYQFMSFSLTHTFTYMYIYIYDRIIIYNFLSATFEKYEIDK